MDYASSLPTSQLRDFIALLKPRVMSLVVFTGIAGLLLAPGAIHPFLAVVAIVCIALGSGAAGAINMWYECDIDSRMRRTENRPLPAGRLSPQAAIEFAVTIAFSSVFIMAVAINLLAAFFLLCAILFYVFVYTIWLKPITPQNIVIGGAAGAFPPLIGWTAVTNEVSLFPIILFLIIFMWTPPNLWALSLFRCDDYVKAGIPMLPAVKGKEETRRYILLYTLALIPVVFLPSLLGYSGIFYSISALILNLIFLWRAYVLYKRTDDTYAIAMFRFSIVYLFAIFFALIIDKLILTLLL